MSCAALRDGGDDVGEQQARPEMSEHGGGLTADSEAAPADGFLFSSYLLFIFYAGNWIYV
jgi:hypothetical protein